MSFALTRPFRHRLGWRISAWYATGFIVSFALIDLFASWLTRLAAPNARGEALSDAIEETDRALGIQQMLMDISTRTRGR